MNVRITFPEAGKLRSRKVVSRSNARSTVKHPSWKMGRMIQSESRHEHNAFMLLDASPSVISYNEQPCILHYEMDGVSRRHYPDALVVTKLSKELWEIKERSDAESPEVAKRTALLTQVLPQHGYSYRVVLAEQLSIEPLLSNVKKLLMFGNKAVPLMAHEQIRQLFIKTGSIPWQVLIDGGLGKNYRYYVTRLILDGTLEINMNEPLTRLSLVKMSAAGAEDAIWLSLLT